MVATLSSFQYPDRLVRERLSLQEQKAYRRQCSHRQWWGIATMRDEWNNRIGGLFGMIAVLPSVISFLVGGLTIIWQSLKWFQTAIWPALSLRDALVWSLGDQYVGYTPNTGSLGLDKILDWALVGSPLALWLTVIAPLVWLTCWLLILNMVLAE
jgi:hypothetical protein